MKRKVFSLMMGLILAFTGLVRADELTVNDGTTTNKFIPVYGYYADMTSYKEVQFILPSSDLSAMIGGVITDLTFYANYNQNFGAGEWNVYVEETSYTTFGNSFFSHEGMTPAYSGHLAIASNKLAIHLDEAYTYGGDNLMISFTKTKKGTCSVGDSDQFYGVTAPLGSSAYGQTAFTKSSFLPKTTFTYTGGGPAPVRGLHVVDAEGRIDTINMGPRPSGAWMRPYEFTMTYDGTTPIAVSVLDFTPNDGYFTMVGVEYPINFRYNDRETLAIATGESEEGLVERKFVAIYEGTREAAVWDITAEAYTPVEPDVWEMARVINDAYPFEYRNTATEGVTLYDNYLLPGNAQDGPDAVYKVTFNQDVRLNGTVTGVLSNELAENAKMAIYTQAGIDQVGGPDLANFYVGPQVGPTPTPVEGDEFTEGFESGSIPAGWTTIDADGDGLNWIPASVLMAGYVIPAHGGVDCITSQSYSSIYGALYPDNYLVSPQVSIVNGSNFSFWACTQDPDYADEHYGVAISTTTPTADAFTTIAEWTMTAKDAAQAGAYMSKNGKGTREGTWYQKSVDLSAYAGQQVYIAIRHFNCHDQFYLNVDDAELAINRANRNRDAQQLTVYAGTDTQDQLPLYAMYHDTQGCQSQFVIPASDLAAMNGGEISSMEFHISSCASYTKLAAARWKVYVKEVGYTTMSSLDDESGATVVNANYQVVTNQEQTRMIVDFATPYTYNGGNLLIGFDVTTTADYTNAYFYGTATSGNTGYCNKPASDSPWEPGPISFIPETTFTYEAGTPAPEPELEYIVENITMVPGTYYIAASSTQDEWDVVLNASELPCPEKASRPTPADDADELEPAAVNLSWELGDNTTEYRLVFGSTYYCEEVLVDWTTNLAQSFTVSGLYNNTNYFWRVDERNSNCETRGDVWGFTTHLNTPHNLTADDETIFEGESVVLSWTAIQDRTYRYYNVYQDDELIYSTPANQVVTTYTVEGLEYNMDGYLFYVTAVYDEGESGPSNIVKVKVSGNGYVAGHVYEQDEITGIAGATVTFNGIDEFGDEQTISFITDGTGAYGGAILAGVYTSAVASCEGYQTVTEPTCGVPVMVEFDETTSGVDFVMDENFTPVCEVVAQYYPDSLNPASEYVKVYWGCGLPGGDIIEDFETGDFTSFDWQLDGTYPWTITTNNPYEGDYCMKSGGAGVDYVESNMSVTVTIPNDGEISFFVKPSCEQNYDKGHFYIDGTEMGTYTGTGSWTEKVYPVTAGDHTFRWSYTKDVSYASGDDCVYVDYITFFRPTPPPVPGTTYTFDDGTMQGWTTIDADGDGYNWIVASTLLSSVPGHNGSADFVLSQSYYGLVGPLYPDNYLVSPQVELGGIVKFYACGQDANYAAEHFGVAVSTTGNTNAADFTTVQEWTLSAKKGGMARPPRNVSGLRDSRDQGSWYEFTVDLSAYSGMGYVAIRHFDCSDEFYIDVDDITIGEPGRAAENSRAFSHYRVYRTSCYNDGPYTEENTVVLACELQDTVYIDVEWGDLDPGVYKYGVGVVYSGNRGQEIAGPIHWANVSNAKATFTDSKSAAAKGAREEVTYDFENGLQGWTTIDADGDGEIWRHSSESYLYSCEDYSGLGHNGSNSFAYSQSYSTCTEDSYDAENYLVSPQSYAATANTALSLYYDFANSWWADYFDVCVSTASVPTSASDFTQVWSRGAKNGSNGGEKVLSDHNRYGMWTEGVVDLSAYAGQNIWIAIRHSDYDMMEVWIDDITISGIGDVPGPVPPTPTNPIQEPRESEIVWSNCIDKDMYLEGDVTVNVLLNSADSPEGTIVTFTNLNETEQELYPIEPIILDESGFYAFDSFRRGLYNVKIQNEGYYDIEEEVSIWNATDLRYVMTEIIYGVKDLYVSSTGWAMWADDNQQSGGFEFSEGFEGGVMPEGWTVEGNLCWEIGTGDHHESTGAYEGNYNAKAFKDDWDVISYLITPMLDMSGIDAATLNFSMVNRSWGSDLDGLDVCYRVDGGAWTTLATFATSNSSWAAKSVELDGMASNYQIGFKFVGDYGYGVGLDAVEIITDRSGDRHLEGYKVMCTSIDDEPIFNADTQYPFCQLNTDELVEGEHYICKVASIYSTGMSDWRECVWAYTPCVSYAGTTEGIFEEDNTEGNHFSWTYPGQPGPVPPTGDEFTEGFESGSIPAGWTTIDADGDGHNWTPASVLMAGYLIPAHGGVDCITSESYAGAALYPDNYLVSPQVAITNGSNFSFWACAQDPDYAAEHYGVAISTTTPTADAFTTIAEWTMTAKDAAQAGAYMSKNGKGTREGTWYQKSVDLSAYAGQQVYIAIRHFNCSDMFYLNVDDAELAILDAKSNRDGYLQYCTETFAGGIGTGGGEVWWAVKFPATSLASYVGQNITKLGVFTDVDGDSGWTYSGNYELSVYAGTTAPTTLLGTAGTQFVAGDLAWHDLDLQAPVAIDGTQDLWIVGHTLDIAFPMSYCEFTGDANGSYASLDGSTWSDVATMGVPPCTWMLRGFVESGSPVPPTPEGDILGAMIFRDGEWLAFTTDSEYIDYNEFGSHEYCVRVVYDGIAELPDSNVYYSMSCPECIVIGENTCAAGADIRGEYQWHEGDEFGALISWGDDTPVPPTGDEFTEGFESGSIPAGWTTIDADGDGHNWTPASVLMAGYLIPAHGGVDCISSQSYDGNTGAALYPDNYLVSPQVSIVNGSNFSFWACAQDPDYADEHYGVAISTTTPTADAFTTIAEWTMTAKDAAQAGAYMSKNGKGTREGTWYQKSVDLSAYAGQQVYIAIRHFNCHDQFYLNVDDAELAINRDRAAIAEYNVYRSTTNSDYELIATVPAVAGQEYYEYFDEIAAGNYYYQVTAVYDNGCESEPALAEGDHANNYVIVNVTAVAENNGIALYPNPTNGNVKIEAVGMNHITVVSALGQIVYDAEVSCDEMNLNMAQFNAGIYMVRISSESGVSTHRVTVVR